MSVSISSGDAEAALRAASKAGFKELVESLLKSGVKASSENGIAANIADFYGHFEVADILRSAIKRERDSAKNNSPSPTG